MTAQMWTLTSATAETLATCTSRPWSVPELELNHVQLPVSPLFSSLGRFLPNEFYTYTLPLFVYLYVSSKEQANITHGSHAPFTLAGKESY